MPDFFLYIKASVFEELLVFGSFFFFGVEVSCIYAALLL